MGKNIFNSVKMTRPKRSRFDLSHDVKVSGNMGLLIPTLALDVVPSDVINIGNDSLLRFQPLVAPMMHRCDVSMHYFFVPNRLLWPNWENYITNTKVGGTLPAHPYYTVYPDGSNYSKLMDNFGIPTPGVHGQDQKEEFINPMAMAAYQLIYNEYYRDENLQSEVLYELVDGDNTDNDQLMELRRRAWEHDYFTAALPFAQKGNPVTIPITQFEDVPVKLDKGFSDVTLTGTPNNVTVDYQASASSFPDDLYAQTSQLVGGVTNITELRRAFQLQKFLETDATGGTRYTEKIYAHFGIKSPDARLQRPEYITGTKSPVTISEVLNTTGTDTAPQGTMAGHGLSVTQGKFGRYMAYEHGWIIGIMSIMPKTAYQQGIEKCFTKITDPFEYYWPEFAHIGEQALLNKEVYAYMNIGDNTFGYVPRYAEYKFKQNRVAGDFRSTLDFWHMGRIFETQPALNAGFIACNPTNRVFAVTDPNVDHCLMHIYHKISANRPMPMYGQPMI